MTTRRVIAVAGIPEESAARLIAAVLNAERPAEKVPYAHCQIIGRWFVVQDADMAPRYYWQPWGATCEVPAAPAGDDGRRRHGGALDGLPVGALAG